MTKRHRKQGMQIIGNLGGAEYRIDQKTIEEAKEIHGIDLVSEIENALRKELINNPSILKDQNES